LANGRIWVFGKLPFGEPSFGESTGDQKLLMNDMYFKAWQSKNCRDFPRADLCIKVRVAFKSSFDDVRIRSNAAPKLCVVSCKKISSTSRSQFGIYSYNASVVEG
jgi:hypothetical protein